MMLQRITWRIDLKWRRKPRQWRCLGRRFHYRHRNFFIFHVTGGHEWHRRGRWKWWHRWNHQINCQEKFPYNSHIRQKYNLFVMNPPEIKHMTKKNCKIFLFFPLHFHANIQKSRRFSSSWLISLEVTIWKSF